MDCRGTTGYYVSSAVCGIGSESRLTGTVQQCLIVVCITYIHHLLDVFRDSVWVQPGGSTWAPLCDCRRLHWSSRLSGEKRVNTGTVTKGRHYDPVKGLLREWTSGSHDIWNQTEKEFTSYGTRSVTPTLRDQWDNVYIFCCCCSCWSSLWRLFVSRTEDWGSWQEQDNVLMKR